MMNEQFITNLRSCLEKGKKITFLVGAGLSSESGIPTFRGKDGYWTIGSENYRAEEVATKRMFDIAYDEVWKWYLYRKSVTEAAQPNAGHYSLAKIEKLIPDNFALISQNVDGLHLKAGSNPKSLYQIHGDLTFVRCAEECSTELYPFPKEIQLTGRDKNQFTKEEQLALMCPKCGNVLRPHVLWFDEYYNEEYYSWDSVHRLANETAVLFIIGTSGATNLPQIFTREVLRLNGMVVEVNTDESLFTPMLQHHKNTFVFRTTGSSFLAELETILAELSVNS
jgi:NAD-dependent deacetylase